jgi:hypothetical protein
MHGTTYTDYLRELKTAEDDNDLERIFVLQTAREMIESCEFRHLHSVADLDRIKEVFDRKVSFGHLSVNK